MNKIRKKIVRRKELIAALTRIAANNKRATAR